MSDRESQSSHDLAPAQAVDEERLHSDVRGMILAARERVALYVNQELTLHYWGVGERIRRDVLGFERAPYGRRIIDNLAVQLVPEFGEGYSRRNLFSMLSFATIYPDGQIVQTLSAQLSWSHFIELLRIDDPNARAFYGELTRLHRWGVRPLREKIRSRLYERTLLSRKPDELIQQELALLRDEDRLSVDVTTPPAKAGGFLGNP
ncbi:DUF1016 N-terminal domain-containing protein [Armatimonas sp.]|uniref:DUF1016 N-terminal domain-containing protein n=1 Tax=Armatimonas sp. TaxID=1872638 RepID=UPI00374DEF20